MDELLQQFAIEAHELVQQVADDLLALEQAPDDRARLESAFRAVHTLKGSVGLFDLAPMQAVLHAAEDLLGAARSGSVEIDAGVIDPLVAVIEWTDLCVTDIERSGRLSAPLGNQAPALLALLSGGEAAVADAPDGPALPNLVPDWALALVAAAGIDRDSHPLLLALRYEPHPECYFNGDDPLALLAEVPELLHLTMEPREAWPAPEDYDPFRCNLLIEALAATTAAQVQTLFRMIPDQVRLIDMPLPVQPADGGAAPAPVPAAPDHQLRTMRVEATRIDALVDIAGELVTAKNGLLPLAREVRAATGDDRLAARIIASQQEMDRLIGALHAAVMRARMVPLGQTFRRFPRLVRETAARLGKSVDLVIEGDGIDADREIVENLFEPLLHLVRNALDHGIEPEAERLAAGKPGRAVLTLRASQRGEQIHVTLNDDGRGIDPARLRTKAVTNGVLTEDAADAMSDADALQLSFAAGLSTAETVSDLSGRGVGLDAVKTAVELLGGRIELVSSIAAGTAVTLLLPVSFAMSRLMVVEAGGERYGVPIEAVVETLRIAPADVMPIRAGQAFVLRDRTLPLLHLAALLQLPMAADSGADHKILVVRAGRHRVGIAVDGIAERAETLLRPLSGLLRGLPGIAGTTLLGDGKVLVVLDLEGLIGMAETAI